MSYSDHVAKDEYSYFVYKTNPYPTIIQYNIIVLGPAKHILNNTTLKSGFYNP